MAKTYPAALASVQAFVSSKQQKRFYQALPTFSAALSMQTPPSMDSLAPSSRNSSGFRRPQVIEWKGDMPTNKATFIGVVIRDVKIRYLDSGKIVAHSSIQVSRRVKDDSWFYLEFWGDLAEVAAAHLKVQDTIYVSGSVWSEKALGNDGLEKTFAKVVAEDLKFVRAFRTNESEDSIQARKMGWTELWEDVFSKSSDWIDYRNKKPSARCPDFKHRLSGQGLWLDNVNTPFWVKDRLAEEKDLKFQPHRSLEEKWLDFFADPSKWWDNRLDKAGPSYPDFNRKDTWESLWVDNRNNPEWVKEKLKSL